MQNSLITLACFWLIWIFILVSGRPNPVPNDELNDHDLDVYEINHDKLNQQPTRVKRHRRVIGPEDPDDMDVVDELAEFFPGIRRRVRDVHETKPSIFQPFIERAMFSGDEDSKDMYA